MPKYLCSDYPEKNFLRFGSISLSNASLYEQCSKFIKAANPPKSKRFAPRMNYKMFGLDGMGYNEP